MTRSKSRPCGLHRSARRDRQLGVARIGEDLTVGEHHQRQRLLVAGLGDKRAPFRRVGEAEGVGEGAPAEHLAQLMGPPRPRLADDVHGVRGEPLGVRPLEQEGRDRLVEQLVGDASGADQVVVDLAPRHRREDRLRGRADAPAGVVDQEAALCLRMVLSHPAEQLASRRVARASGRRRPAPPPRPRRPVAPAPLRPRAPSRGRRSGSGARSDRAARVRSRGASSRSRRRQGGWAGT